MKMGLLFFFQLDGVKTIFFLQISSSLQNEGEWPLVTDTALGPPRSSGCLPKVAAKPAVAPLGPECPHRAGGAGAPGPLPTGLPAGSRPPVRTRLGLPQRPRLVRPGRCQTRVPRSCPQRGWCCPTPSLGSPGLGVPGALGPHTHWEPPAGRRGRQATAKELPGSDWPGAHKPTEQHTCQAREA